MGGLSFNSHRIRWVAFDAVGTLIQPVPAAPAVYHQIGARHGSKLGADEVELRFRQAWADVERGAMLACGCANLVDPLHTCEERERLRWQTIVEHVLDDIDCASECFRELFAHFGHSANWRCFEDVDETLKSLQCDGYRLAVSSNFDRRLHPVMDGLVHLRPIELRIISSEVGHRKPSPQFFQALLEAAECEPSELFLVGDDRENDVAAAIACGIPAIEIDRTQRSAGGLGSLVELAARLSSPAQ